MKITKAMDAIVEDNVESLPSKISNNVQLVPSLPPVEDYLLKVIDPWSYLVYYSHNSCSLPNANTSDDLASKRLQVLIQNFERLQVQFITLLESTCNIANIECKTTDVQFKNYTFEEEKLEMTCNLMQLCDMNSKTPNNQTMLSITNSKEFDDEFKRCNLAVEVGIKGVANYKDLENISSTELQENGNTKNVSINDTVCNKCDTSCKEQNLGKQTEFLNLPESNHSQTQIVRDRINITETFSPQKIASYTVERVSHDKTAKANKITHQNKTTPMFLSSSQDRMFLKYNNTLDAERVTAHLPTTKKLLKPKEYQEADLKEDFLKIPFSTKKKIGYFASKHGIMRTNIFFRKNYDWDLSLSLISYLQKWYRKNYNKLCKVNIDRFISKTIAKCQKRTKIDQKNIELQKKAKSSDPTKQGHFHGSNEVKSSSKLSYVEKEKTASTKKQLSESTIKGNVFPSAIDVSPQKYPKDYSKNRGIAVNTTIEDQLRYLYGDDLEIKSV